MEKKKESKSTLSISKHKGYRDMYCVLNGVDLKRQSEFNKMKTIEVTKDELNKMGTPRWLQNI